MAIAGAAALAIKYAALPLSPRPWDGDRVRNYVRTLAIGVAAGELAGVLVGGFGGRLMMRVMAATSGRNAQGLKTEADEVVGRVSFDGTLGLILFVGLGLGLIGGVGFMLLRRWLPGRAWQAGLVFGGLALVVFGPLDPLDPGNRDFAILRPVALAVVILIAVFLLYGVVLASLVARLDGAFPPLARDRRLVAYLVLFPLIIPSLAAAAVAGGLIALMFGQAHSLTALWRDRAVDQVGRGVVAVAGGLFAAHFVSSIVEILT